MLVGSSGCVGVGLLLLKILSFSHEIPGFGQQKPRSKRKEKTGDNSLSVFNSHCSSTSQRIYEHQTGRFLHLAIHDEMHFR